MCVLWADILYKQAAQWLKNDLCVFHCAGVELSTNCLNLQNLVLLDTADIYWSVWDVGGGVLPLTGSEWDRLVWIQGH